MKYLSEIIEKMKNAGVELIGCDEKEIEEVNIIANNKLPNCYIEFLEIMGNETKADETQENWHYNYPGFQGNTVFYPSIKWLNEALEEQLKEDGDILKLPDNAFVFYDSQGILNAFFKLDEGDNPPVYGYEEGFEGKSFPKIADSLSSFYTRYLEGDKTLFKELR